MCCAQCNAWLMRENIGQYYWRKKNKKICWLLIVCEWMCRSRYTIHLKYPPVTSKFRDNSHLHATSVSMIFEKEKKKNENSRIYLTLIKIVRNLNVCCYANWYVCRWLLLAGYFFYIQYTYITASRQNGIKISYRTHRSMLPCIGCWLLCTECTRTNIDFFFCWISEHNGYLFFFFIELLQVQTISPIFAFYFFVRLILTFLFRSSQQTLLNRIII